MMESNVWILDIETSPLVALVWQLGQQFVSKEQVVLDWHIMSFTAKRLHAAEKDVVYMETRTGDDGPLLKKLWEIFDSADVVITQNGKKFDEPKIRARMMLSGGFKPYKPFRHHDTYAQNTDKEFTSHSLDYLSSKFCKKYKKLKHKLFSGLSLWKECLGIKITFNPNPKAWKEMRIYNTHDVLSDEELYLNTRGWSKNTAPPIYFTEGLCPYCGSKIIENRGPDRTLTGRYQRKHCKSCGKWWKGAKL